MQGQENGPRDQRALAKDQNERQQVERQRQHPQQRRGGNVCRDVVRERRQQPRRHERKADPAQAARPCRSFGRRTGSVGHGSLRIPHAVEHKKARRYHCPQQQEAAGPCAAQRLQPEHGLQNERIAQQRQQTAEIARSVEKIRVPPVGVPGAAEPGLKQRRVGGNGEKRRADGDRKKAHLPQIRIARRRLLPARRNSDRQRHQRDGKHRQMHDAARARRQEADQHVRVEVSRQQRRLEEAHGDRPHRRRAAEHGQHHLGEHRLHGEQQQRRHERRRRIEPQRRRRSGRHGRCRVHRWHGWRCTAGRLSDGIVHTAGLRCVIIGIWGIPIRRSHPRRSWARRRCGLSSPRQTCPHRDRACPRTCRSGRARSS